MTEPRRSGPHVHPDCAVAAVLIAATAILFGETFRFDEVPAALMSGLGAEFFPRLVLGAIAVMALLLAWRARGTATTAAEPLPHELRTTLAASIAFMAAVPLVGLVVAMAALVFGLGRLWGERRTSALAVSAVAHAAAIWFVFVRLFGIKLERGALGEFLFG